VAGCVGWRPGFDPRPCVGFVVDKVALIQLFPLILRFSRLGFNSIIFICLSSGGWAVRDI
jgi:hypothetical protein